MVNVNLTYITAADGDIALGFLTAGKADDSTELFVYQTNSFTFDYDSASNIRNVYSDVFVNGVLVEDCALTAEQYYDIREYGVGIYTYHGDELVYSSFDEEWGRVTWNNGQVKFELVDDLGNVIKTLRFPYSEVKFNVFDITNGKTTALTLLEGWYGRSEGSACHYPSG